jgi:hypothetical protein
MIRLHWSDAFWVLGYIAIIVASAFWSCGCGARSYVSAPTDPSEFVAPIPPPPQDAGSPPQERLCCSSSEAGVVVACALAAWLCTTDGGDDIESLAYCGTNACEKWTTCWLPEYQGAQGMVLPCLQ